MPQHPNKLFLDGIEVFADAAADRVPPGEFLLLPYGKTQYTKGTERSEIEFGPADADKVLEDFSARAKDVVVDYEHQTLSGQTAPAAGWISKLEKTATGVVAHMKYWTEQAMAHLKSGEYRYSSPVLHMSRRRPFALHSVALTNHPALHGLPPLVASDDDEPDAEGTTENHKPEKKEMENLLKLLGIAALADEAKTEALVLETVQGLVDARTARDAFLALHDAKTLDDVTGKIKGMVPAADKLALETRLAKIEAEKAVVQAFTDQKLVESQREWALKYAAENPAGFAEFIAKTSKVAPGPASTVPLADTNTTVPLTDEALGKEFDNTEALRDEFRGDKASYLAYRKADAAGLIKRIAK